MAERVAETAPAAFLSYAHLDDAHDRGGITAFRVALEDEIKSRTGRDDIRIFQDRNDIAWGEAWKERIDKSLDAVTFLVPVLTPRFLNRSECRRELERFLDRERLLGRSDLILPVYWISLTPRQVSDVLAERLFLRQHADWRELRYHPLTDTGARKALARLAEHMRDVMEPAEDLERSAEAVRAGFVAVVDRAIGDVRAGGLGTTDILNILVDAARDASRLPEDKVLPLRLAALRRAAGPFGVLQESSSAPLDAPLDDVGPVYAGRILSGALAVIEKVRVPIMTATNDSAVADILLDMIRDIGDIGGPVTGEPITTLREEVHLNLGDLRVQAEQAEQAELAEQKTREAEPSAVEKMLREAAAAADAAVQDAKKWREEAIRQQRRAEGAATALADTRALLHDKTRLHDELQYQLDVQRREYESLASRIEVYTAEATERVRQRITELDDLLASVRQPTAQMARRPVADGQRHEDALLVDDLYPGYNYSYYPEYGSEPTQTGVGIAIDSKLATLADFPSPQLAEDTGAIRFVDRSLRVLYARLAAEGRTLPSVYAAILTEAGLTLHMAPAEEEPPPAPWKAGDAPDSEPIMIPSRRLFRPSTWRVDRLLGTPDGLPFGVSADIPAGTPAPYPGLVTVGSDETGSRVLINIGGAPGIISLGGDDACARDVAVSIAVELATNPWSNDLRVCMIGFSEDLTRIAPHRIRLTDSLSTVIDELDRGLENSAVRRAGADATGAAPRDRREARTQSIRAPDLLVLSAPPASDDVGRLARVARGGTVGIISVGDCAVAEWRFAVHADGRMSLGVLGLVVKAQNVAPRRIKRLWRWFLPRTQLSRSPAK